MLWGQSNYFEWYARMSNSMAIWVHNLQKKYYQGVIRCDEPMCGLETRQVSVHGGICLRRGCNGKMHSLCTERTVHTHLKYLETLFDIKHACQQLKKNNSVKLEGTERDWEGRIPTQRQTTFNELHDRSKKFIGSSSFNWISPTFWQAMLVGARPQQ
jgi:DNA polymerase alpha subunit A